MRLPRDCVQKGEWSHEIWDEWTSSSDHNFPSELWSMQHPTSGNTQAAELAVDWRSPLPELSLKRHGRVGQEPAPGGRSSVDVLWESRWAATKPSFCCFLNLKRGTKPQWVSGVCEAFCWARFKPSTWNAGGAERLTFGLSRQQRAATASQFLWKENLTLMG